MGARCSGAGGPVMENYYVKLGRRNRSYIYQIVNARQILGKAQIISAIFGLWSPPGFDRHNAQIYLPNRRQRRASAGSASPRGFRPLAR